MIRRATATRRGDGTRLGAVASLLAVWSQVVFLAVAWAAAAPAPFAASSDDALAGFPICHASGAPAAPDQPAPPAHDCPACVLCVAGASHAWASPLSAPVVLPAPRLVAAVPYAAARPRAPPAVFLAAAQPRGPPRLI